MALTTYIEARAVDTRSIYDRAWELCAGTETLSASEARACVREWKAGDRDDYGCVVSEYRYIDETGVSRML